MGIYSVKPLFRRTLGPFERALVRRGVSADVITTFGLVAAGTGGLGIWLGRTGTGWLLLVPLAAFLRTAANALDGMVATSTGTARPLGEVFNETADRLADTAMFLPIVTVPGVADPLVAGALAAMLATSYLGLAVKAAGGHRVYAGVMGKPDRMLVLGAGALGAVADPDRAFTVALWVVLAGCALTLIQRWLVASAVLGPGSGGEP